MRTVQKDAYAFAEGTHYQIPGIEYLAVNADRKALEGCLSTKILLIGSKIARGEESYRRQC